MPWMFVAVRNDDIHKSAVILSGSGRRRRRGGGGQWQMGADLTSAGSVWL